MWLKDPAAVLDWYFDWAALSNETGDSDWLASGETITEAAVTVTPSGLTAGAPAIINGGTAVRVWLSAGNAGSDYRVTCQVTTSAGRIDERSETVKVRQR